MAKLREVFPVIRNGASIRQTDGAGGLPITRIETISNREIDRSKFGYAGIEDVDKYREYILQDGDILMSHINSEKHLGKVALYKKQGNEKIIHGMNLLMLRVNKSIVYPPFATYFFSTNIFLGHIQKITKKSVNQASFTVSALKEIEMDLPSLEEQRKIAAVLDKVSDLIAKRRQQLDKLDELVKARFVEMFGTPLLNEKGWPVVNSEKCCNVITDGSHFSPVGVTEGVPMLSVKDMKNDGFHYDNCKLVSDDDFSILEKQGCVPQKDDVLIAKDGSYFYYGFVLREFKKQAVLSSIAMLRPNISVVNPDFLCHYMLSIEIVKLVGDNYVTGAALKRVILKGIKQIPVMLPPLDLQNQFSAFVEQTDKIKLTINRSLEKLETLKKALMQQYFG